VNGVVQTTSATVDVGQNLPANQAWLSNLRGGPGAYPEKAPGPRGPFPRSVSGPWWRGMMQTTLGEQRDAFD